MIKSRNLYLWRPSPKKMSALLSLIALSFYKKTKTSKSNSPLYKNNSSPLLKKDKTNRNKTNVSSWINPKSINLKYKNKKHVVTNSSRQSKVSKKSSIKYYKSLTLSVSNPKSMTLQIALNISWTFVTSKTNSKSIKWIPILISMLRCKKC